MPLSLIKGCGPLEVILPFQNKKGGFDRRGRQKQTSGTKAYCTGCVPGLVEVILQSYLGLCYFFPSDAFPTGKEESLGYT